MVLDPQAQGVAQIVPGVLDDQARRDYQKAFDDKRDTTGGLGSMDTAFEGAELFDLVIDGKTVGRYALKAVTRAKGTEVFVIAATGRVKGVDLLASVFPAIEQQCQGADRVTVNTRRRGMVKKLLAMGWTLDSFVLRKKIK